MNSKEFKNFAKNLKIFLKEKNLKQTQFAELMKVSNSCVSKWILEQREPTLTNISNMLKILNCTFEDLIDD